MEEQRITTPIIADPIKVDPIAIDVVPQDLVSKQLKLLLIEMVEHICHVASRIDMSDPTIINSLNAFKTLLKNLETL